MALILINVIQDMILNNVQEVLTIDSSPNANAGSFVTFKHYNSKSI